MENALRVIAAFLVAYLVGSIPVAFIVVRIFWRQDIRTLGSGNTGATNVLRVFGTAPGLAVLAMDMGKGALAVWLASLLVPSGWDATATDWVLVGAAIAAVIGHSFSPWIGFSGGKGVATAAGALMVAGPGVWPIALVIFLAAVGISRMVSAGSIAVALTFPIICWLIYPERIALLLLSLVMSGFVLWRHRSNIRRIAAGDETKISFRRRLWGQKQAPRDDGSE